MTLVDLRHAELGIRPTCEAVGVSRATWYRRKARAHAGGIPVNFTDLYELLRERAKVG